VEIDGEQRVAKVGSLKKISDKFLNEEQIEICIAM
jgi:hypothetical protein